MNKYFNFNGTAKRQEYWAVILSAFVAYIVAFTLILMDAGWVGPLIALWLTVATLWALLAVTVKRLRDAGLSIWWILVTLVPYAGTIASIVFGCIQTQEGEPK